MEVLEMDIKTKEGTLTPAKECPFGVEARFCKYQETYAKDLISAAKGELIFLCKLDNHLENCPMLKEGLNDRTD